MNKIRFFSKKMLFVFSIISIVPLFAMEQQEKVELLEKSKERVKLSREYKQAVKDLEKIEKKLTPANIALVQVLRALGEKITLVTFEEVMNALNALNALKDQGQDKEKKITKQNVKKALENVRKIIREKESESYKQAEEILKKWKVAVTPASIKLVQALRELKKKAIKEEWWPFKFNFRNILNQIKDEANKILLLEVPRNDARLYKNVEKILKDKNELIENIKKRRKNVEDLLKHLGVKPTDIKLKIVMDTLENEGKKITEESVKGVLKEKGDIIKEKEERKDKVEKALESLGKEQYGIISEEVMSALKDKKKKITKQNVKKILEERKIIEDKKTISWRVEEKIMDLKSLSLDNPVELEVVMSVFLEKSAKIILEKITLERVEEIVRREEKKEGDKYTQIEAWLKVWASENNIKFSVANDELISKVLLEMYGIKRNLFKYVQLVKKMIENERKFFDGYYFFYHGYSDRPLKSGFLLNLQSAIKKWLELKVRKKDLYVRFKSPVEQKNINDFFVEYTLINDLVIGDKLLSVNFCPFAAGKKGEGTNTFEYFLVSGGVRKGYENLINKLFDDNKLDKKFLELLKEVHESYAENRKHGSILQILIPKGKTNDFVYLAKSGGPPYIASQGEDFWKNIKKKFGKGIVSEGEISDRKAAEYLNMYRNMPVYIRPIINKIQGRIVLFKEFFEPESGVKIFNYNLVSEEKKKKYKKDFYKIVDKMMNEWLSRVDLEYLKKEKKTFPLFKLLRKIQKGQEFKKPFETRKDVEIELEKRRQESIFEKKKREREAKESLKKINIEDTPSNLELAQILKAWDLEVFLDNFKLLQVLRELNKRFTFDKFAKVKSALKKGETITIENVKKILREKDLKSVK
ncbi:hypothetical protein ACFLYA_02175 [Candidatus Dependentiae bacterium]